MGQSYFIWKNKDCRSMGVKLAAPVPIIRPEERVQHIQIPGRVGDLTLLEGENIYNSYIQTASIMVHGGRRIREVYDWLRGADYVTFSGEPDKKQPARIIGAVTLNKHSHNLDWWEGEVQFYCQPLKEKIHEDAPVEVTTTGTTVRSAGDVDCYPMVLITASASLVTVAMGGETILIQGLTDGNKYWLDNENKVLLNYDKTEDLTLKTSGPFVKLTPGENIVQGNGWSKLEITKRERFL